MRVPAPADIGWQRHEVIASLSSWDAATDLDAASSPTPVIRYLDYYGLWFGGDVSQRIGTLNACGYRVVVHRYVPPGARGTVLVVHGYFDHVGLYRHLIRFLVEEGYAVVTWDQPGHGLSSGELVAIESFRTYQGVLDAVLDAQGDDLPPWQGAVGQSTGCAALTEYILAHRADEAWRRLPRYIFLAPLLRPTRYRKARIMYRLISPFRRIWKREFSVNSHDPDFIRFLQTQDPLQPRVLSVRWVGALERWVRRVEHAPRYRVYLWRLSRGTRMARWTGSTICPSTSACFRVPV
ncbi:alpha/beta hydrolase [Hahella sp. SMD15-11]|uniref:Alpha/beta hydrolase n=1 Tax=Thermohahella caldifontis TaxID=3142973 RepID=A0AB39V0M6_9GAMM